MCRNRAVIAQGDKKGRGIASRHQIIVGDDAIDGHVIGDTVTDICDHQANALLLQIANDLLPSRIIGSAPTRCLQISDQHDFLAPICLFKQLTGFDESSDDARAAVRRADPLNGAGDETKVACRLGQFAGGGICQQHQCTCRTLG